MLSLPIERGPKLSDTAQARPARGDAGSAWQSLLEDARRADDFRTYVRLIRRHERLLAEGPPPSLPEHSASRGLYEPGRYAAYIRLVKERSAGLPVLDLTELLSDGDFMDAVHATPGGARRITENVMRFVRGRL